MGRTVAAATTTPAETQTKSPPAKYAPHNKTANASWKWAHG